MPPLSTVIGKENVLKAAQEFFGILKGMTLRAKFGSEDKVMVVYDVNCADPIGNLRTAILVTLADSLIISIELFNDTRLLSREKLSA